MPRVQVKRFDDPAAYLGARSRSCSPTKRGTTSCSGSRATCVTTPASTSSSAAGSPRTTARSVGAALQTPRTTSCLARTLAPGGVEALADALRGERAGLPGVTAAVPEVEEFAGAWVGERDSSSQVRMRAADLPADRGSTGSGRPRRPRSAADGDRRLLLEWVHAFARETFDDIDPKAAERQVAARLDRGAGGFALWEQTVGRCRSSAGEARRRTASASGPCTRRRSSGGAATRARSPRPSPRSCSPRTALLLPLHGRRERDREPHLRRDRLRAGLRLRGLRFRAPRDRRHGVKRRAATALGLRRPRRKREPLQGAAGAEEDDGLRAELLTQLARVDGLRGDFEEGERRVREAEALAGSSQRAGIRIDLERGRLLKLERRSRGRAPAVRACDRARRRSKESSSSRRMRRTWPRSRLRPRGAARVDEARHRDLAESGDGGRYWVGPLLNNLGWDQFEAGEHEAALASFEQALEHRLGDPENREAIAFGRYAVAKAQQALGRHAEAAEQLELAVAWTEAEGAPDGWYHEALAESAAALGRRGGRSGTRSSRSTCCPRRTRRSPTTVSASAVSTSSRERASGSRHAPRCAGAAEGALPGGPGRGARRPARVGDARGGHHVLRRDGPRARRGGPSSRDGWRRGVALLGRHAPRGARRLRGRHVARGRDLARDPDRPGRVHAEGDLDFRGTLGVDREAPVGFRAIRLRFDLEPTRPRISSTTLLRLTERYCVVYQSLAASPELSVSLA